MRNAEKLAEGLQTVVDNLSDGDGALGSAQKRLFGIQQYDSKLQNWAERLTAAS